MNTNFYNRRQYTSAVLPLQTEEDKDSALRLLTIGNIQICRGEYGDQFLNVAIQTAHKMILHKQKDGTPVGFALLKLVPKKKVIDILLVCTIPNNDRIGQMIAHSIFNYAIRNRYLKFYVAPRTPGLRETFVKYGFEHLRGIRGYDEVLVNTIAIQMYNTTSKTLRSRRANTLRRMTMKYRQTLNRPTNILSNVVNVYYKREE